MHDTFLVKRLSESLGQLCKEKRIGKITKLKITTSKDSHIFPGNLIEHLMLDHNEEVGEWTELIIDKQDIDSLTAVIESIEGELLEQ